MATTNATHGHTVGKRPSREYLSWLGARARCENPAKDTFRYYGGRGIRVADRWRRFASFLEDMGPCPPGMSLDRIDADGDYAPGNCRWATRIQQMRNKRTNRLVTIDGETRCVAEWAELSGLAYTTILRRLARGWAPLSAISLPVNSEKPTCPAGHPYSGDNLLVVTKPNGWKNRICVTCKRRRGLRSSRASRGVAPDHYRVAS